MEDIEDFSFNTLKLIVRTRLDLEPEFQDKKEKKSLLWAKVVDRIKEIKPDFDMTREQTNRKFLNLQITYRRIKNRSNVTGRCATTWEFYDMFDEVYGAKHSTNPPYNNLQSSLDIVDKIEDEEQDAYDSMCSFENVMDEPSYQSKKARTGIEPDIFELVKKEAESDEEKHEFIGFEGPKNDIEQEIDIEDFNFNTQKLIIRTRLDLEQEFQEGKKKKSVLWGKVIAKIKEIRPDFDMTREQISRKFVNLHTTYRRIKKRIKLTGRNATSWEFYDMFDEVYGSKHCINPSSNNLPSSSYIIDEIANEGQYAYDSTCSLENEIDEPSYQKKKKLKISYQDDVLEFLKRQAERDDERHKEVMELERRKLEMEQERIKVMVELKNVLQKML